MKNLSLRNGPRPLTWRKHRKARSSCAFLLAFCLISYGLLPLAAVGQVAVSGNIHPNAIQIDNTANFFDNDAAANVKNTGATVDWVKDILTNTDDATLENAIATGLIPNVTSAVGGTGHWYGVRIIDFFGNADEDIFAKGGKVADLSSWHIEPGSTGSAKFDATQAFIANNQQFIFFGMMRKGNDGTTAYEFEFNQAAPPDLGEDPNNGYVPTRTNGDILITFELQGSGGDSGSVLTYITEWDTASNPDTFIPVCDDDPATTGAGNEACPVGLFTSINADGTVPPPWGYVDSKGAWVRDNGVAPLAANERIERRIFAEAQVPLSLLPGVGTCGGSGFVQVRTRSSRILGSDAKDTTPIFEYIFGGPTAAAAITGSCALDISFSGAGSANSSGDTSNSNGLSYAWTFERFDGTDWVTAGTANTKTGTFTASVAGRYRAKLIVTEATNCTADDTSNEVDARVALTASASKTNTALPLAGSADANFSVTMTGEAQNLFTGDDAPTFQWQKKTGTGSAETDYTNLLNKTASTLSFSLADLQDSTIGTLLNVNTPTALLSGESYKYQKYSFTGRVKITRTVNGLTCPANSNDVTVRGLKAIDP